eukprot:SAG11_NODE_2750_length_3011_cov_17.674107_1_plen_93_part_00
MPRPRGLNSHLAAKTLKICSAFFVYSINVDQADDVVAALVVDFNPVELTVVSSRLDSFNSLWTQKRGALHLADRTYKLNRDLRELKVVCYSE